MPKVDEATASPDDRDIAERLYAAYTANSDNLNYQGLACPAWADLTPAVRSHWCAVAIAADQLLAPGDTSAQDPIDDVGPVEPPVDTGGEG